MKRIRGSAWTLSVGIVAILLAACIGPRTEPPAPAQPRATADPGLPSEIADAIATRTELGLRSEADYVEAVHAANDSLRHDMGILVTPEEAAELDRRFAAQDDIGVLAEYGAEHPDTFGGLYIDQAAGGEVVLLFTRDVELHARAISALAPPGVTVRARRVDFTEAELNDVMDGLNMGAIDQPGVEMVFASVDIIRNVVTLEVKTNDGTFEQRLEDAHGGRLEVTVHPIPGPWQHASDGDGWRLISFGEAGGQEAYTVRAATDEGEWAAMWEAIGLGEPRPEVDFRMDIAVSFAHGIGSSCREVRLDDVVIADEVVFGVTSDPLSPRACTSDLAGAAVFVVAVSRDALPADGFTLRLSERTTTCDECGFTEEIDVRLP